jgi:hypothetical protein
MVVLRACRRRSFYSVNAQLKTWSILHKLRGCPYHVDYLTNYAHLAQTCEVPHEYKEIVALVPIHGFGTKKRQLSFGRPGMHHGGDAWTLFR